MNIYKPVAYLMALAAAYVAFGGCSPLQSRETTEQLVNHNLTPICLEQRVELPKKESRPKNITYHQFLAWQMKSQIDEYNESVRELERFRNLPAELKEAAEELKTALQK